MTDDDPTDKDSSLVELFGGPLDGLLHTWTPDDPCPPEYTPLGPFLALWEGLHYTVESVTRRGRVEAERGPWPEVVVADMMDQVEDLGGWCHLAFLREFDDLATFESVLTIHFAVFPDPKPVQDLGDH